MSGSKLEFEIEASRSVWSSSGTTRTKLDDLLEANPRWADFFPCGDFKLEIGKKIAEGTQAQSFEGFGTRGEGTKAERQTYVLKVFKKGFYLKDLEKQWLWGLNFGRQWPLGILHDDFPAVCPALGVNVLKDDKLGIVYPRLWGDLRTLIDQRMMTNMNKISPFDLATAVRISLQIAEGMDWLHRCDIIHKDLKASTILINTDCCTAEAF